MGRAKITMERINNSKKRKLTFNTRKQGLVKKARELTTLCDVNVSIIILADDQQTPEIFPQDPQNLYTLIDLYKLNHCMNPGRTNHYDLADYYVDRKMKIEEELVKIKKKNLEAKYPLWFDFLDNFSETELREFALGLENKIVDVKRRIDESVNNFVVDPVGFCGVDDNMIMQLSNPNFGNPNSLVNMTLNEDDDHNMMMQLSNPNFVNPDSLVNNMIMQLSNPNLVNPDSLVNMNLNEDDDNMMMQLSNPNFVNPYSLVNMILNEDDDVGCDGGSFLGQPPLMEDWFSTEMLEQFLATDFASQVMKDTRANGAQVFNYLF